MSSGDDDVLAAVRDDVAAIEAAVEVLAARLEQLAQAPDLPDAVEQLQMANGVLTRARRVLAQAKQLVRNGRTQDPGPAVAATSDAAVAETQAESGLKQWPGRLWESFLGKIKEISQLLWNVIVRLLTVKEWTVQGTVQADGSLLGMASASVSVTFGKP